MFCVFLITEKASQSRLISIVDGEKSIFIEFSPRLYNIELLEKHQDKFIAASRVDPLRKLYNCPVKSVFDIKKEISLRNRKKPGPKPGSVFKITEEDRERRRKQFSKGIHPNSKGLSEEHKKKISETKKLQPSNFTGKKHSEETKRKIAEKKIGNQHRKGWILIYHPVTGEERVIKETDKLPLGFRYGKPKSSADNFNK